MTKIYLLCLLLATGCAANLQHAFLTTASDGSLIYHYDGFTDPGETDENSGKKYMMKFGLLDCPRGFVIQRYNVTDAYSGLGHFLYWNGEGQCKGAKGKAKTWLL